MKPRFEELHIGQKVWMKEEEIHRTALLNGSVKCDGYVCVTISKLIHINGIYVMGFEEAPGQEYCYGLYNILLEPPKSKKRYWQWKIKIISNAWFRSSKYMDEAGFDTIGGRTIALCDWRDADKIKIEDDWVEDSAI